MPENKRSKLISRLKVAFGLFLLVAATTFMLWDVNRSETAGNTAGSSAELVIGTDPGFKPFEYKDGQNVVGFDIDLARNLALDQNKTLRIEEMAFDSLLLALQSGRIDLAIAGMTKTPDRAENVDFSDPYYSSSQMIIVPSDSSIKNEVDLVGKRIGVQLGTTGDDLARKIKGTSVIQFPQPVSALQELSTGRIDAVIMDNGPAAQYLPNNKNLKMLETPLSHEEYAIAIRKGNTELLEKVNASLAKMKADGRYNELIKKHFDSDDPNLIIEPLDQAEESK